MVLSFLPSNYKPSKINSCRLLLFQILHNVFSLSSENHSTNFVLFIIIRNKILFYKVAFKITVHKMLIFFIKQRMDVYCPKQSYNYNYTTSPININKIIYQSFIFKYIKDPFQEILEYCSITRLINIVAGYENFKIIL